MTTVDRSTMKLNELERGMIVKHKLIGKVIVTKIPDKKDRQLEVRRDDGSIMFCYIEEVEKLTQHDKLKRMAIETKKLAELALLESDLLDKKS